MAVAQLRRENEYLAALRETALALMNRLNVTELLEAIISRACALIGTEHGYIYQLTSDGNHMEVSIGYGAVFENSVGRPIKCGEGLAGRVWESGQPMALGDYSSWPHRLTAYADYSYLHALLGVPLKSGTQVVGVLGLAHVDPDRTFSSEDLTQVGQFAELASIALDNAHLYTAAQIELAERKRAEAAQRHAYEALRQSEQRYRALFEYTSDGVSIFDLNGDTVAVNKRIADMLGYKPEELVGTSILSTVSPTERRDGLNKLIALLNGQSLPIYERTLIAKDGSEVSAEINIMLVRDEAGKPLHIQSVVRDITARKRTEQRLQAQYAITRALAEASSLTEASPLVLEAVGNSLRWSLGIFWLMDDEAQALRCETVWHEPSLDASAFESFCRKCAWACGEGLPGRVWATNEPVWIADVTLEPNYVRAAVAAASGLHSALGFPIPLGNKVLGVIEFLSTTIRKPNDDLLQLFAAIGSQIGQFVERKQVEEQFRLLSSAIRSSSEAVVITDIESNNGDEPIVLYANDAYFRLSGRKPDEILGKPSSMLRSTNINPEVVGSLYSGFKEIKPVRFESLSHRADGTPFWAEFSFEPIKDEEGNCIHWVAVMRDITEHKQYEQQLLYLSTHDYLTDLPNRRALEERLALVIEQARTGDESAMVFIDLDNFKEINDTTPLGHDAGDQALKFIAELLGRRLRDQDMLARLGGDEFAVLLEHTTLSRAEEIARRLSASVSEEQFTVADHSFHITLSVGLVAINGQQSARTVLFQADTAMYIAKKQGGNRVIVYRPSD